MPNHREHRQAGGWYGGVLAAYMARDQRPRETLTEVAGGVWAGKLAAGLADIIDPPTSFRHRGIGHGLIPAATAVATLLQKTPGIQDQLRQEAARHADEMARADSESARLWHLIAEHFLRFLSGVFAGVAAGYASHLVLDAGTPMGLPLFA